MTPRDRSIFLRNISQSLEKLGRVSEAYAVQKEYVALNDSLHRIEMGYKVHNLERKYEAQVKETEILRLNEKMQEQLMTVTRNRFWMFMLGGIVLLLGGVLWGSYSAYRKRQLIARQQATLLGQEMDKMRQGQQISMFSAMLEGQEQERKRLAIDLHDGLGGSLSSIKLKLSKVALQNKESMYAPNLLEVIHQLDSSIDDLRRIARNMMPETLLKFGLDAALRDFCKGMETDSIKINFQGYDLQNDIPRAVQIMVFRIVQELVTNAIKHAQATHIIAQCMKRESNISLTVEDNGIGLDSVGIEKAPGMGLSNVKNRVAYMGGTLDIQTEKGVGTTVMIELNYEEE